MDVAKSEQTVNNRIKEGLLLRGKEQQHVERFKYLGTTPTANCDCSTDIRIRTATALKVMSDLNNIWKNKNIKNETKMRLYRSLILPCMVAKHGHLSAEEKQLLVFEMAALRKILEVRIIDKMRNNDVRKALNQTEKCTRQTTPVVWSCTSHG